MGKGGMRYGAGRPAHKGKAEACMRLDVRDLARRRALWAGSAGSWSWTNSTTGEHVGSISYRMGVDDLVLSYTANGEPRTQRVPIRRTACHFGNTRPWFGCPHCWARVAVLYFRRGGFYCRDCARVAYYSQSEDVCARSWRKQQKAEAKLGKGWARPKGMHAATREKLLATIFRCEDLRDAELARFLAIYPGLLD